MNSTHYCLNNPASNATIDGLWLAAPAEQTGFNGTTCSTVFVTNYSNQSISITFLGTQLTLEGGFQSSDAGSQPTLRYAIDGDLTSFALLSDPANHVNLNNTIGTILQTPQLTYGLHTVNLTTLVLGDSSLVVDSIQVVSPAIEKQLSAQSINGTSTINATNGSTIPASAIAGGVVCGVMLLVAAVLAFYFMYWRRRHNGPGRYVGIPAREKDDEKFQVTPLILSQIPTSTPNITSPTPLPDSRSASLILSSPLNNQFRVVNSTNDTSPATTPRTRKAAEARAEQERSVLLQHRDSGVRFGAQAGPSGEGGPSIRVEDVPPTYSES